MKLCEAKNSEKNCLEVKLYKLCSEFKKCIPLRFDLFFAGWFGMRKDFCEFLLEALPLLREYGNTSYKFADTIVSNANGEEDSNSSLEMTPTRNKKRKETQKLVGTVLFIDAPD